jgi:hypothetical protein
MFQRLMSSVLSLALLTLAPALAQENKFAGRLLQNRYHLNFQDGRLSGTGLPVLQNALATQFVLIGEHHGISQIPQFAGAVCDLIGPQGFHTMAIEAGPWPLTSFNSGSPALLDERAWSILKRSSRNPSRFTTFRRSTTCCPTAPAPPKAANSSCGDSIRNSWVRRA